MTETRETAPPLLIARDLQVNFGPTVAVERISFEVRPGERVGLIGESGSGKSVTALAAIGLLPATAAVAGDLRWNGVGDSSRSTDLVRAPESDRAPLRGAELAMVHQEPMTALDPTMRIRRQVGELVRLHAQRRPSRSAVTERVVAALAEVGFDDPARIGAAYPHQLSGGQRQRILLAMALINEPALLICDEPTTALDAVTQLRVLDLIDARLAASGAACLFISHDLAVVARMAERLLVMRDGVIVEDGPRDRLLAEPQHPYTADLVRIARHRGGFPLPTLGQGTDGQGN